MELPSNNEDVLLNFPSCLRTNIKELCLRGKIGLSSVTINDISIVPNRIANDNSYGYHFIIKIPYAGKRLSWEVIFNPEDYDFAPDFDFNDEYFLANPNVETIINNVPSLNDWDLKNPNSMKQVLSEFLSMYKKEQLEKLKKENMYAKVREEYDILVNKNGISSNDVEVSAENNIVHLLININIDFNTIPEYFQQDPNVIVNPGEDYVHLRMSYTGINRVTPVLMISPRVEQTLGNSKTFHIPEYKSDTSLLNYIDEVTKVLEERIEVKVKDHEKRRKFISHLIALNPEKVINYDLDNLMTCTMIYSVDDVEYLIEISVDYQFPQKRPRIFLMQECDRPECKDPVRNMLWNQNQSIKEMVNNVLNCLKEELPRVRNNHKH